MLQSLRSFGPDEGEIESPPVSTAGVAGYNVRTRCRGAIEVIEACDDNWDGSNGSGKRLCRTVKRGLLVQRENLMQVSTVSRQG